MEGCIVDQGESCKILDRINIDGTQGLIAVKEGAIGGTMDSNIYLFG